MKLMADENDTLEKMKLGKISIWIIQSFCQMSDSKDVDEANKSFLLNQV